MNHVSERVFNETSWQWLQSIGVEYPDGPPHDGLPRSERFAEGDGLVGLISRVWTGGLPATVVVKRSDPERAERLREVHRRETLFAAEIGPRAGVRVPHIYFAHFDAGTFAMTLVMEDLAGLRFPAGAFALDDALTVLTAVAGMHARWWNAGELAERPELLTAESYCRQQAPRMREALQQFVRRFDGQFLHETMDALARLPEAFEREVVLAPGPVSLVHGDLSSKNLVMDDDRGEPVIFDWSQCGCFSPARDVYALIAYSLRPGQIASAWRPAINHYLRALDGHGRAWDSAAFMKALQREAVALLAREIVVMGGRSGPAMDVVIAHNLQAIPEIIDSLALPEFLERHLA